MRKLILSAVSFALLTVTACKKDDNSSASANQFTIAGKTFTATTVQDNSMGYTAVDVNQSGSIAFAFAGGTPKQDVEYTITAGGGSANKVSVVAADQNTKMTYVVNSGTVTVKFNNGKASISMPNATGTDVNSKATAQISANVSQ